MQDQNKKLFMWVVGLSVLMVALVIPELLIAKTIYPNEQDWRTCLTNMILITMFLCIIIYTIRFLQYYKFVKEYRRNKVEEAKKELTSEFKKVFINYSGDISKDMFECKAKVDEDGKIVCEIFLDMKITFESYEKFLEYFQFNENK